MTTAEMVGMHATHGGNEIEIIAAVDDDTVHVQVVVGNPDAPITPDGQIGDVFDLTLPQLGSGWELLP
jgi:hypothetical protein